MLHNLNMHACLKIPEILTNIFSQLSETPPTLASVARTCKLFTEPALDLLWHFQPSLSSLIQCLPIDAICIRQAGFLKNHYNICLTRDLQPSDYTRLYYYSSRIVTLGSSNESPIHINSVIPSVLLSRKPSSLGPLFPRLRHFNAPLHEFDAQAPYPRLVVGPRLQTLNLYFDVHEYWSTFIPFDNIASIVAPPSPGITEFTLMVYSEPGSGIGHLGSPPEIMQLCCSFQALESLNIPSIRLTHPVLAHLATLPRLRSMNISTCVTECTLFNSTLPSDTDAFPSLLRLYMTSDELTACSNLFLHPGFQCLQSLTIARVSENGNWELDPFFHVLRGRLSPAMFSEVILCKDDGNSWSPSEENQRKITFNTLIPLLSFPNLSVLKIELDVHVELDDAAIRMAAQAWPCLRIFRLFEQSTGTIPAITPAGLLSLIVSCPNLEQLTLRMNMLNVPSFAQLGDIIPAGNLYRLNVCTSPIKHSAWVASFLTIAFPVLSDLVYGWQYSNYDGMHELPDLSFSETIYFDEWEAVLKLLGPIMASHNSGSGKLEWEYT